MAFLNPWLLLGIAGVSVPIAIHLLNRFRPRRVQWAAMDLLRQATVVRSRQVQLEDLLLLLLRCLAVLLLALALARPTLPIGGAALLGGDPTAAALVGVDASYSMSHRVGLTSRFDGAIGRLRDIASTLTAGSPFTLVQMGQRPRVVVRNSGFDPAGLNDLVRELEPRPELLGLEDNLEELARLVQEMRAPTREIYLITDAQANAFGSLSDQSRAAIATLAEAGRVFVVPVRSTDSSNLAVTNFELASGVLRRGGSGRFIVEVRNFGEQAATDVAVTLSAGDQAVDRRVIESLEPGQTARVALVARFDEAGPQRFVAAIGSDAIELDNQRFALVVVREQVRVLLVDGDPRADPFDSETGFAAVALSPSVRLAAATPSIDVTVVPWPELAAQRLGDFDVVVLANVADVRPEVVEPLTRFVQRGGGLIFAAGDNVNATVWNERFADLLPARLAQPFGDADERETGWRIEASRPGHPLAQPLLSLPDDVRDEAQVFRAWRVDVAAGAEPVLQLTGPGVPAPLVVDQPVGAGRVLLITTALDRAWSDWVIHPLFPMLLHQSVTHLLRQPTEVGHTVGRPLIVPLPPVVHAQSAAFHDPRGGVTNVAVTDRGGTAVAELPEGAWPGFYDLRPDDGSAALSVAVNVDTRESEAATLDADALGDALAGLPVRILDDAEAMRQAIRDSRVGRELWRPLVLLALIVLMAEAILARRFSARMKSGASPLITVELSPIRREPVLLDEAA